MRENKPVFTFGSLENRHQSADKTFLCSLLNSLNCSKPYFKIPSRWGAKERYNIGLITSPVLTSMRPFTNCLITLCWYRNSISQTLAESSYSFTNISVVCRPHTLSQ